MSDTRTMTVQEAATLLGVNPVTITRAIRDGRLRPVNPPAPILKRARAYLLYRSEVERFRQPQPQPQAS